MVIWRRHIQVEIHRHEGVFRGYDGEGSISRIFIRPHQDYLGGIQGKLCMGKAGLLGYWATGGDSKPHFGNIIWRDDGLVGLDWCYGIGGGFCGEHSIWGGETPSIGCTCCNEEVNPTGMLIYSERHPPYRIILLPIKKNPNERPSYHCCFWARKREHHPRRLPVSNVSKWGWLYCI